MGSLRTLSTIRAFADHYQLFFVNGDFDHWNDPNLKWTTGSRSPNGNLAVPQAIYLSTKASLNEHRIRIMIGSPTHEYAYVDSFELDLSSGKLMVYGIADLPEERCSVELEPGEYILDICASNLGVDQFSEGIEEYDIELDDDQFFGRDEFEHYDVFLRPA